MLVSPDEIEEHFLQELKFCYESDPQHADFNLTVRRLNLEHMGARLKAQHEPFRDRSDFEIGCTNATVDPNEIKKVLENKSSIFKGKYLIVLAEEHLGLLDWNGQDHLTRKLLVSGAHSIFSANPRTIAWTRGEGDLSPEQFRSEFKTLKPCLHGSDAHRLEDIGKPAGERYWIKADTTFEGLKQVLYEPKARLFIGDQPPQLKHNFQIIESVRLTNAPGWFEDTPIPLNRDLVAIIGPRGSGKSALAEVVAFAGGAGVFKASSEARTSSDISDKVSANSKTMTETANSIARTGSAINSCAAVDREDSPSFAKASRARSTPALHIGDAASRSTARDTRPELVFHRIRKRISIKTLRPRSARPRFSIWRDLEQRSQKLSRLHRLNFSAMLSNVAKTGSTAYPAINANADVDSLAILPIPVSPITIPARPPSASRTRCLVGEL